MYRDKSTMSDTDNVTLHLKSASPIEDQLGLTQIWPVLVISCRENKTALYINWARFVETGGVDGTTTVRFRIDQTKAQTASWNISTNFEATGLWSGGRSIPLIRRLINAKQFIVETTPYGSNTVTAKFNIEGLDGYIPFVQKECHWN